MDATAGLAVLRLKYIEVFEATSNQRLPTVVRMEARALAEEIVEIFANTPVKTILDREAKEKMKALIEEFQR